MIRTYLILTLVPYPYGGGESFMHQTLSWLQGRGFRCVWIAFWRHLSKRTTIRSTDDTIFHTFGGYPTEEKFQEIYSIYNPDFIHLQGPIVYLGIPFFKQYRIPLLVGFHFWTGIMKPNEQGGFNNRNILDHTHELILDPLCQDETLYFQFYVASDFINRVIESLGGQAIENVIYPVPPETHYKAPTKEKKYITCININKGKGGDIFYELVKAIKNLPFLGICNEPNPDDLDEKISQEINGKILSYCDVKDVYAETKILLIPSHVDETFSRVAYEAAANAIPIITTGKGFVSQLLGDGAIYLGEDADEWVSAVRDLYYDQEELSRRGKLLQEKVSKIGDQQGKFLTLADRLISLTPKRNIMILAPWCDQGLGQQARLYSQLLRQEGYKVHVFSFLSYFCIDQPDTFQQDATEWLEYDTIYYSYNTREEITNRELRQFVLSRNVGICLIPEICFDPIFEKATYLKTLAVDCYAIPNIETCRRDEVDKYHVFDKILCNTRQCYNTLQKAGVHNLEYIGHCLPIISEDLGKPKDEPLRFIHISGYNALTRKQTLVVLESFQEARKILGDKIELTVTFSRNVPVNAYKYQGNGITFLTKPLSHNNILKLYTYHHVSIQVSSHEGLGLGFYESLACETPVISLKQAPHNEVIKEGISGWLLPSEEMALPDNNQGLVKGGKVNCEDLTNKIIYLSCHREDVEKVTRTCYNEKKRWDRQGFVQRLVRAFES